MEPRLAGQISALRASDSMLKGLEGSERRPTPAELAPLLEMADREYARLISLGDEYYLLAVNPPFMSMPDEKVDRIMGELGSVKDPSGSWLSINVESKGNLYKVWGRTLYCG